MKTSTLLLLLAVMFGAATDMRAAEHFGSIGVSSQSLVGGETYHGYREYRFLLENTSQKETHEVTLVFPDRSFDYGHSVRRISRRVRLAPGARVTVPIWQPPLRQAGNGMARIIVDGQPEGVINMPGNLHMNHASSHASGTIAPGTVLVSRSLNFDDLSRSLGGDRQAYSAAALTGPPDSRSARGVTPTAWTPDPSAPGPHWFEADFNTSIIADRLLIFDTMGGSYDCTITLKAASGTNLAVIPVTASSHGPPPPGAPRTFSFPRTTEPVSSVHVNFGMVYAGMINMDAVQLDGAGRSVWADVARVSSALTGPFAGRAGMVSGHQALRSEVPIQEWSDAWLSYTPFDAVAIHGRDWQMLLPGAQAALQRYVECGGTLMIFGNVNLAGTWNHVPKTSSENGAALFPAFGRCVLFASEHISDFPPGARGLITEAVQTGGRTWRSTMDEESANATFPVVENVKIPVREIVVIMLAFVITIGPLNIVYLSRKKRRVWLLWTIPAISFVTTLGVFGYSVIREGFTPDIRMESITCLDQQNHRAITLGMVAYYCPLTPGGGLRFDSETEVTPQVSHDSNRGNARELDWTQGQHLERGWVTARVPAHFQLRKPETRRERIQVEGTTLMNGLGVPIRELWFADASGKLFAVTNIPAGAKAALQPAEGPGVRAGGFSTISVLAERFAFRPLDAIDPALALQILQPNTYIARLNSNPFLEPGLSSASKNGRKKESALVYGILETSPAP
ncbi:MAG TPA: hypothetical protein VEH04_04940 [Verrucomicrobiae bacterium]|nr:hypothetical protein [Verrucomicrobiae bacterium]